MNVRPTKTMLSAAHEFIMDTVYGCGSGVLRVVGMRAWARYLKSARALHVLHLHIDHLRLATEDTQKSLKHMTDDLINEQSELDRAIFDVKVMTKSRIEERKLRAMRMGVPLKYKPEDVLLWMNDYSELQRIEDLRICKMKVRRLENRIRKLQFVKNQLQFKQVAFEDVLSTSELAEDLDRVATQLEESNSIDLSHLLNDIVHKVYKLNEEIEESVVQTGELQREVDDIVGEIAPKRSRKMTKMDSAETQDILNLIFETTEAPVPVRADAGREAGRAEAVALLA